MQWLMLQQDNPEDYVIATGLQYSVRKILEWSAFEAGIELSFEGKGLMKLLLFLRYLILQFLFKRETLFARLIASILGLLKNLLLGDASKARNKLGWKPNTSVKEMCSEMVKEDIENAKKFKLLKDNGYHDTNLEMRILLTGSTGLVGKNIFI